VGAIPVTVVEDAAHALGSEIDGRRCGTLGRFGCFSFHATKNVVAGEGGALVTADGAAARSARIFREKGTNRDDFTRGRVDHYAWVGLGSSLVLPELGAALARTQLAKFDRILDERRRVAGLYDQALAEAERRGLLTVVRPVGSGRSSHHIYGILVDPAVRASLVRALAQEGIEAASHFVPLHASPFGRTIAPGLSLPRTDRIAASIVRLPIYPGLADADVERIAAVVCKALGA
jgi:dTDP-4-amino-4,6-dideoxygalactose transaminase